MEVTGNDLERDDGKLLKEIIEAIENADFGTSMRPARTTCGLKLTNGSLVALDLEFSGVQRSVNTQGRRQTIRERYIQLREGADKYQVLQLGLCIATYDDENGTAGLKKSHGDTLTSCW
jgi:hypothetical protein